MEDAIGEEQAPHNLTLRILAVNFAAIHTTSMVSGYVLLYISLLLAQLSRVGLHIRSLRVASSVSRILKTTQGPHSIYQSGIHPASPGGS